MNFDPAWQWWQDKLTGKPVQMNEGTPHAGFYRWPKKTQYGARKTYVPVAYWPAENGRLHCRIGDDDVTFERGEAIWPSVGNHPVTQEAYRTVAEDNGLWPDEHELVPMGDNLPPEDEEDTFESLEDKIRNLAREAKERLDGPPITSQDEADQIANLADRLSELWNKADGLRKAERKPHDEALKEIQKNWSPMLMRAETYRNLKSALLTPWLKRLEKAQREEAEAAAAAAGDQEAAPEVPDTPRPRAGTRGRAMSLKKLKYAELTDYDEALKFFAQNPEIKQLVQDLANRWVRTGLAVPGTKVVEESRAV